MIKPCNQRNFLRCGMAFAVLALAACSGQVQEPETPHSSSSLSSSSSSSSSANSVPVGTEKLSSRGDFSSGQEDFRLFSRNPDTVSATWDEVAKIDITEAGAAWHVQLQHDVALEGDKQYTLCYQARASAQRNVFFRVEDSEAPETSAIDNSSFFSTLSVHWQRFAYTFRATKTDATTRVAFYMGDSIADVELDDIHLYEGDQCSALDNIASSYTSKRFEAEDYSNAYKNGGSGSVITQAGPNNSTVVTGIENGEWFEYEIDVPNEDNYALNIQHLATTSDSVIGVLVNGVSRVGSANLNSARQPGVFQSHQIPLGKLTAGRHILRVFAVENQPNTLEIDWFSVASSGPQIQPGANVVRKTFEPGSAQAGSSIYAQQCVFCHGANGEGNEALKAPALKSCSLCDSFQGLANYIDEAMPTTGTGQCVGDCAADVSAYIIETFNKPFDVAQCNAATSTNSPSVLKRLSRSEYLLSLRDLLDFNFMPPYDELPEELEVGSFNTVAEAQNVTTNQLRAYFSVAQKEVERMMNNNTRRARVIGCNMGDAGCLKSYIERFGRQAYRRPLNEVEVTELLDLATTEVSNNRERFSLATEAMLTSPEFLYRLEVGGNWTDCAGENQNCNFNGNRRVRYGVDDKWAVGVFSNGVACGNDTFGDPRPGKAKRCYVSNVGGELSLNGYELASRLSFALWGRGPDNALLDQAANGALDTESSTRMVIQQMLADNRAKQHLTEFFAQWLELNVLNEPTIKPDSWYDGLLGDMKDETNTLLNEYAWGGKNFLDIFTANHTYLTPALANYYRMNDRGSGSVTFSEGDPRAHTGLLTHGAMMFAKRDGDLVAVRGNWLRRTFLCKEIHIPTSAQEAIAGKFAGATPLEIIHARNTDALCKGCHAKIDPIGIGLVNFDEFGAFDYTVNLQDFPLDAGFPDVDAHDNISVKDISANLSMMPEVAQCIAENAFYFTRFKQPKEEDQCTVAMAAQKFEASGYDLPTLIFALTEDGSFRSRRMPPIQ